MDPHDHGWQPYGGGCVVFKDQSVGALYKHDSPYTYFSSSELHLGEISLECSRPGASAVALWATQRLLPLIHEGEFSASLSKSRQAALSFYGKLLNDSRFKTVFEPELDIVIWVVTAKKASEISELSLKLFDVAALHKLHLATFSYPSACLKDVWNDVDFDRDNVTCLRSCLMKPEHSDWLEHIWLILSEVTNEVMNNY